MWYSHDSKTADLIDYVIVNQRLARSVQDTGYIRVVLLMLKLKITIQHLVVSRVNLKLKFQKGNCLPGCYDVYRLQNENLRETLQE